MARTRDLPEVVTPIVHSNGDRKETLIRNLREAYQAVQKAQYALQQAAPNARNFYPEPGRFERYQAQYRERQGHVQAVMESLEAEVLKINRETRG